MTRNISSKEEYLEGSRILAELELHGLSCNSMFQEKK